MATDLLPNPRAKGVLLRGPAVEEETHAMEAVRAVMAI